TLPKGWRGNGQHGPDRITLLPDRPPGPSQPGPATGSATPVKSEPVEPVTPAPAAAIVHARVPVPPVHPAQPAPPPAAHNQVHGPGKGELLQALTGSAESARGAIAGADRAGF